MLNRIRLTNFQRHRALEVVFNGGLTALRGANEAGKSTLLRSICYALFGVKGLGATLDELVTWGEDPKTLRVELELSVDGMTYTVKRGKPGAEVNYDGGTVTGQNEVTAFVCRLLKVVDAAAATRLILANQGDIRGALEAGAAETTKLIERLADFDQIDNLLELMQEELTLGATGTVEAAIASAEKQLDAARAAAVAPDVGALDDAIENAALGLDICQSDASEALEKLEKATQAFNDGKVSETERAAIEREIKSLNASIDRVEGELKELRTTPAPDNVDVPALRQRIADSKRMDELWKKWEKVSPFIRACGHASERDGGSFEGTVDDLEQTIRVKVSERSTLHRLIEADKSDARLARQQVTDGSCGFCGQDFSNVPEVQAKNATLLAAAEAAEKLASERSATATKLSVELDNLRETLAATKPVLKVLDVVGDLAKLTDNVLPPYLEWIGPDVTDEEVDVAALQAQIDLAEKQQREFERAGAKIETLSAERVRLYSDREAAYARRAKGPHAVDLDKLRTVVESARDALRPLQDAVNAAQQRLTAAERAKADAISNYERAKADVTRCKEELKKRRAELDELEFNNGLLKRVRQCRPMIADQLWNLVLNAVSTYFSEMRGVKSKVRKNGDGFTVDGHVVSGATMSGSTLDVLGLAIRVALVRTFMPMAPFLILDEPASACDDGRTNNMLGFLASAGFRQVLLVTHEDISQAVADNMITL